MKRMYYQRQENEIEVPEVLDIEVGETERYITTMPTTNQNVSVRHNSNTGTPTQSKGILKNGQITQNVSSGSNLSMTPNTNTNKNTNKNNMVIQSSSSPIQTPVVQTNNNNQQQTPEETEKTAMREGKSLVDSDSESEEEEEATKPAARVTRSGRVTGINQTLYKDHVGVGAPGTQYAVLGLTKAEMEYQERLKEMALLELSKEDYDIDYEVAGVGAGIGGGFTNTNQLKVMKYEEAIATDAEGWENAVKEEYDRMMNNNVWKEVPKDSVPEGAKILTSTWACKLKANGTKRARINARGYEQIDGIHYDSSSVHSPVTNDTSVRIVFVLALMAGWIGRISDVKGAFLKGSLDLDKEQMYMHRPKGFEKYIPDGVLLQLLMAIYGTKQAAMAFWRELLKCMYNMDYKRNGADPCLYFKWTIYGLIIWLSWVDDCMVWGPKEIVTEENEQFTSRFDCDDVGEVKEYVGCKIIHDEKDRSIKFVQPVMIQSFGDEFDTDKNNKPTTPAVTGQVLVKGTENTTVSKEEHTKY